MIPLDQFRKLEPEFATMSDEKLSKIRSLIYQSAGLALESFLGEKCGSKKLDGVLAIINSPVSNLSHE